MKSVIEAFTGVALEDELIPELPIKRDLILPDAATHSSVKVDHALFAKDRSREAAGGKGGGGGGSSIALASISSTIALTACTLVAAVGGTGGAGGSGQDGQAGGYGGATRTALPHAAGARGGNGAGDRAEREACPWTCSKPPRRSPAKAIIQNARTGAPGVEERPDRPAGTGSGPC